jgi:hypothetical protein
MSSQANSETAKFWGSALAKVDTTPIAATKGNELDRVRQIKSFEEQILVRALEVSDSVLRFAEIEPTDTQPPEEWIRELGEKAAQERFRIAKAAWMGANEAPIGIKTSAQLAASIIKARSTEKSGPKQLNIGVVHLSAPIPTFDVVDVEPEGEER